MTSSIAQLGNNVFSLTATQVNDALTIIDPDQRKLNLPQDPLALSWASYYVWIKNGQRWAELRNLEAHQHDIEMANETRRFYRDQLVIRALKGIPLTKFQQDLYDILINGNDIKQCHLGMLHRLPYFYCEDQSRLSLTKFFANQQNLEYQGTAPTVKALTPVMTILKSRRSNESDEYWFADQDGNPVRWSVQCNNPLAKLAKGLFVKAKENNTPLRINATWTLSEHKYTKLKHFMVVAPELA